MPTLFVVTTPSQTVISVIHRLQHRLAGELTIIDLADQTHIVLKAHGIGAFPLRVEVKTDWGRRDTAFRQLTMPGAQLGESFTDTQLPIYKTMAMDRLSFWYLWEYADKVYEAVMAFNFDEAYVSADIHNPIGWALAKHSGYPVYGVKCGSFRTREWYDLLQGGAIPFRGLWVEKESDVTFLKNNGYAAQVEIIQ